MIVTCLSMRGLLCTVVSCQCQCQLSCEIHQNLTTPTLHYNFRYSEYLPLSIINLESPSYALTHTTSKKYMDRYAASSRYWYWKAFTPYSSFLPADLNVVVNAKSTRFVGYLPVRTEVRTILTCVRGRILLRGRVHCHAYPAERDGSNGDPREICRNATLGDVLWARITINYSEGGKEGRKCHTCRRSQSLWWSDTSSLHQLSLRLQRETGTSVS